MPKSSNTLDLVAEDLAYWIDDLAGQLAEAMSAGGAAPFAAPLTENEKLTYYLAQLFNTDGTPNMPGRAKEMQRLGPEGFAMVYKAVIKAHPNLAIPSPPPGAPIPTPFDVGTAPAGPALPGLPATLGLPRQSLGQQQAESSNLGPATGTGPLG